MKKKNHTYQKINNIEYLINYNLSYYPYSDISTCYIHLHLFERTQTQFYGSSRVARTHARPHRHEYTARATHTQTEHLFYSYEVGIFCDFYNIFCVCMYLLIKYNVLDLTLELLFREWR